MSQDERLLDTHEVMPDSAFFGILNGAGNGEGKAALALLLYNDPTHAYDNIELAHMFNHAQGATPARQLKTSSALEYCTMSFVPNGVTSGPDADTAIKGSSWQASGEYQDQAQAMLGFLTDWALGHPELPLATVFGGTSSPTEVRSPHARYCIYQAIRQSTNALSLTEISDMLGDVYSSYPLQAVSGQVASLETAGILQKSTNRNGTNPLILIADPDYHNHHRALENTSPATQALYKIAAQLGAGKTIHLNDLMDRVLALDPSVDTVAFRRMLRLNIDQQIGYPGLQWVDHKHVGPNEQTEVAFAPEVADAVRELIDGLERIRRGEDVPAWVARAREIATDPDDFRALVAQGHRSSTHANTPGREALAERLRPIIKRLGGITVLGAQRELRETLRLTRGGTYELLTYLVRIGMLTSQEVRTERHSGITASVYRLAEDEER